MSNYKLEQSLFKAVKEDNKKKVDYILRLRCDVNAVDEKSRTPIMFAKSVDVADLLIKYGAELTIWTLNDTHILHEVEDLDVLKFLVKKGADVNCKNSEGISPLMQASLYQNKERMEALIDVGADVNTVDNKNRTPIYMAVLWGSTWMIELLVEKGAIVTEDVREIGSVTTKKTLDDVIKKRKANREKNIFNIISNRFFR